MPNCIVLGCPHRCGKKDEFPEVILHSFPRSLDQIKAWLYQTGQIYEDLDEMAQRIYERKKTNGYRLCSAHFTKDSYIINRYKKILRPDALPSIFPSPGAYYGQKRPRKKRKRNKDSSQVFNPPPPMVWKETWTNRDYLFEGEKTQRDMPCSDNRDFRWYNKSVSDRDHARFSVHPRPHPQFKEEQLKIRCAGNENGDMPHSGLLTSIKSENIDEDSVDQHEDDILRILVDSPKNEDDVMSAGMEDKTNSRATDPRLHEAQKMPKCIVKGCPHFAGRKNSTPGVTLHMFPKDLNIIRKWLKQTNQDFGDLDLFAEGILQGKIGVPRVCSAHFAPECYALAGSQKILLDGSIPTIFPERDKASNMMETAANPVFQNIYLPVGLWTDNMSVVSNVASWEVNQVIGPDVNQDIELATNGLGVNISTSAIEHNTQIIPTQYGNPPTTNSGKSPLSRFGNKKARAKLPKAKPQKQPKTVSETGLVAPDPTTNKVNKAIQWPEYENNVSGELWKVMHDHFYKVPRKYKEMKRCSAMSEYGIRKYLDGNDTESELFSTLQYVANVFSMSKSKELKSTRMLNQALEIVSLIAGEEWVIVKKNSIHNGVHELTGEVPVKCGDVAVYFSLDEWDYIDEHKEDYEDFVTDNIPMNRTWEVPEQWDSDPMTEYEDYEEYEAHEEYEEEDILDPPIEEEDSDWEPDSDMECEKKEFIEIPETVIKEEPQMTHKCDQCEEAFPDEEALEAHKPTHIQKCEDCEELFSTKAELIKHRAENHATKRFACTICGIQYDYKSQFTIHLRAHTGEKPFACEVCGKNFGHRSSLLVHQRRHTEGKTFECNKCDRRFDKKSELVRHEKVHSLNQPYKCNKCGKMFPYKTGLQRHRKQHDDTPDEKSEPVSRRKDRNQKKHYKCKVCGKKFLKKASYEKHMWHHDDY